MNYTEITSRKNPTVLFTSILTAKKKCRDESGLFVVEGFKLCEEAIAENAVVTDIFFTKKALSAYLPIIERANAENAYLVTDEVYEKMTDESSPQGILAVIKKPSCGVLSESDLKSGGFLLLDGVQNPLNIGAILRCCYAMGFEKVIFSDGCADLYSPKCVRATMGSLFKITPYFTDDMPETAKKIISLGNRIFCTRLDGDSRRLGEVEFCDGDCFVIGNEGHGASDALSAVCTDGLYIPMNEGAESLNAATAAAVVMWEMKKGTLCK